MVLPLLAGGAILGGVLTANAQEDATRASLQGNQAALDEQARQFDTLLSLSGPNRRLGALATDQLSQLFFGQPISVPARPAGATDRRFPANVEIFREGAAPPTPTDPLSFLQLDPGFNFRLNRGFDQLQNTAAARGSLGSGATLRGLEEFRQGLASDEFGNSVNRLLALAGLGQTANQSATGAASASGNAITNLLNQQGAINAQGIQGRQSAFGDIGTNLTTLALLNQGGFF